MASLPNRFKIHLAVVLAVCLGFAFTPLPGYSAEVDVYAEGAYTDTDLEINIYANINANPLISFGVKVMYPTGLVFHSATKNEDVWYFGDGATNYPYMEPEDEGDGVVIIGGKLKTNAPTEGVTGRVLLGTVKFTHSGVTDFSGVDVTYARGNGNDDYKNFVANNGYVYDGAGVGFTVTVLQRGDANMDGVLTFSDMSKVRTMMNNNEYSMYADCIPDGVITFADMSCIRSKM